VADDLPADAVPIAQLSDLQASAVAGSGGGDPVDPVDDADGADGGALDHTVESGSGPSGWVIGALAVVLALMVGAGGVLVYQKAATPGAGSVDVGFLQDMTTHHQQAVEMASVVAENGDDPDVRAFAREIIAFQQYEVGYMEALLEEWGQWPFPKDRTAMEWMGMSSTPADMPGMQTEAKIRQLVDAKGSDVDALFIPMMIDHHRGGVHMAQYAAQHASDPRVRDLAQRIVTQQSGEIADFQRAAKRLGVPL